jgi:dephospho-CoA kinase
MSSQLSLTEKLKLADDHVDCSGTMDQTRRQVIDLVNKMKRMALAAT